MLEPDVTKRANMNQISKCSWLKQKVTDSQQRSSTDKDDLSDSHPTNNTSTGTQTDTICIYGKLHSPGECDCRTNSDDSD